MIDVQATWRHSRTKSDNCPTHAMDAVDASAASEAAAMWDSWPDWCCRQRQRTAVHLAGPEEVQKFLAHDQRELALHGRPEQVPPRGAVPRLHLRTPTYNISNQQHYQAAGDGRTIPPRLRSTTKHAAVHLSMCQIRILIRLVFMRSISIVHKGLRSKTITRAPFIEAFLS